MDSGGVAPQLSEEATHHLQQGIVMLLSQWSALQMAVHNEWGGRQSSQLADQLALDIFSWFTHSREPLYIDDLENILDEAMLSLNTMTEDGSIEEVAEKLMTMHEECLEGNYQSIEKLREAGSRPAVHHIRQAVNEDNDDDDDDDDDNDENMGNDNSSNMIVDAPEAPPPNLNPADMPVEEPRASNPKVAEADDGWVVVASKRNGGKRN